MTQKFTILFDLDGTLINTAPDIMLAHNHVMKKYGYEERDLLDIKKLAGKGSKILMKKSMNEMTKFSENGDKTGKVLELMTNDFLKYYSKNILKKSSLRTGILHFLKWSKKKLISMAVCTNKQEHLSIDLLKKIKIYKFFDYVAGGNTFQYNKPDPRHLTHTLDIIGGDINKTIMIGDSEIDSNSAKNANIPFVLIENGYTEKSIDQIHYDHLIKDFTDLEKIINKYIND